MAGDGGADLGGRFAQLGLLVCEETFLGAGGALGAVLALKTAAQAGMAQGAVATAVAGELIGDTADFGYLIVNVPLPVVGKACSGNEGRQGAYFERRGRMIRGNVLAGIGPLGIAGSGKNADAKGEEPTELGKLFHSSSL